MMKTMIAVLALVFSSMAMAQTKGEIVEHCQAVGLAAQMAAVDRDDGQPLEVVEAAARILFGDSYAIEDMLFAVRSVYAEPHMTPEQEGNAMYAFCIGVYFGGGAL